jgi:hypothetical protein
MKIIVQSKSEEVVSFHHHFGQPNKSGRVELSFGFECSETGVIKKQENQTAINNLNRCLSGADGIVSMGIQQYVHTYRVSAVGECSTCRRHVTLDGFTNSCECGADYNMSGQRLAPRSQWGEETGESESDILQIR